VVVSLAVVSLAAVSLVATIVVTTSATVFVAVAHCATLILFWPVS
jgi:hypothetical protein